MAIPKLMGIENEYGLFLPEDQYSVGKVAQAIIDASAEITPSFRRTYTDDSLSDFLKDFSDQEVEEVIERFQIKEVDYREVLRILGSSGNMLSNGARFYVDLGHPEYSTPECLSAKELIIWDKAGERIVESSRKKVEEALGIEIKIHKDNSDRHGTDFGTHENYLLEPSTFQQVTTPSKNGKGLQLINFLVARQIFCGAGKVGSEINDHEAGYQISQRADFIKFSWRRDTFSRSIINTRDLPFADPQKFRRLHLILGDANLCEYSFFLKVGLTAIFLKMLEDDFVSQTNSFLCQALKDPVISLKVISRDLSLKEPLPLENGKRLTGLNILEEVVRLSYLYFEKVLPAQEEEKEVLKVAEFFIEKLRKNFLELYGYSDWVTKFCIIEKAQQKTAQSWDSPQLKRLDCRYHDLDRDSGLYFQLDRKGKIKHLVREEEILQAIKRPPENSRAYLRGKCIEKFNQDISNVSWAFIRFSPKIPNQFRWLSISNPLISKEAAEEILEKILRGG